MPRANPTVFSAETYTDSRGNTRSANTPAAQTLRAMQMLDSRSSYGLRRDYRTRELWCEAYDQLGKLLGLKCSGYANPQSEGGGYSHDGESCLLHEWLIPGDYFAADIPGDTPPDAVFQAVQS